MEIPDLETLQRLQNHEKASGKRVHEWIAEGMPIGTMGIISEMEAFRQRQQERPPEVPTAIERHNEYSLQRNRRAARETEPPGDTQVSDRVREVISSSGQALDSDVQEAMEQRMGGSLGDVRIHTGARAASACESINARAFTVGNHIAFNAGEYDPSSLDGQHVLAHELAHVRQQTGGAISMLPQEDVPLEIDPDPELEREAEETAQRVMHGGRLDIQRLFWTDVHVQRPTLQQQLQGAIQRAEKGEQSGTEDHEILPEWAEALIAGATLGETGMEDGVFATQYRSHPMYLLGWVGLSMVPIVDIGADIRDAVQNFATGDYFDVVLDLAGLLPFLVSDAPKAISAIRKWTEATGIRKPAFKLLDNVGITKQIPDALLGTYYRLLGFEEATELLDVLDRKTVRAIIQTGAVSTSKAIIDSSKHGSKLLNNIKIDDQSLRFVEGYLDNAQTHNSFERIADIQQTERGTDIKSVLGGKTGGEIVLTTKVITDGEKYVTDLLEQNPNKVEEIFDKAEAGDLYDKYGVEAIKHLEEAKRTHDIRGAGIGEEILQPELLTKKYTKGGFKIDGGTGSFESGYIPKEDIPFNMEGSNQGFDGLVFDGDNLIIAETKIKNNSGRVSNSKWFGGKTVKRNRQMSNSWIFNKFSELAEKANSNDKKEFLRMLSNLDILNVTERGGKITIVDVNFEKVKTELIAYQDTEKTGQLISDSLKQVGEETEPSIDSVIQIKLGDIFTVK